MKLVQKPKIEEQLEHVGKEVRASIAACDIDNQIATVDSLQSMKEQRASFNKEHDVYKVQLKSIATPITTVLTELKEKFKANITEPYEGVDTKFKDKINKVENELKDEMEKEMISYFDELMESMDIDFIKYSKIKDKVTLSAAQNRKPTITKNKKMLNEFANTILKDLELIGANKYKDKILIRYKKILDASTCIIAVQNEEKELEDLEIKRKAVILEKRKTKLMNAGLLHDKDFNIYRYDDEIFVDWGSVEAVDDKTFEMIFNNLTKAIEETKPEPVTETTNENKGVEEQKEPSIPVQTQAPAFKAPTEKKVVKIIKANFHVEAPLPVLKALGQYMRANGIKYENINSENVNLFIK